MKIAGRLSAVLFCIIAVACARAEQKAASVYKSSCAQCHGATGEADTPAGKTFGARSLNSPDVVKMSDADLLAVIKTGKGKMPAWEGILTDGQVKDVITYIRTLQKSKSPSGN
jgi:mono/diheme cytochrome c family protein